MTSKNDITGDYIQTKTGVSDAYEEGWDRIFGKKKCSNSSNNSGHSPDSQCDPPLVDWNEERIDTIGQNGNNGDHYEQTD